MNEEKTKLFYQKKIEQLYETLDKALDLNMNREFISKLEDDIIIWETGYRIVYGEYFYVDENRRVKR